MYADLETFTSAIERLSDLYSKGHLRLLVSPSGVVFFRPDRPDRDLPAPGGGLYADVFDALSALAAKTPPKRFVSTRMSERSGFGKETDEDTAVAKYEAVKSSFPITELQRRVWLRATSKVHWFDEADWEIAIKLDDSESKRPGETGIPYATLKLTTGIGQEDADQAHVFAIDAEDIRGLIDQLEHLHASLIDAASSVTTPEDVDDAS